ncbi:unnamed protein product [Meloidogyne enterolobii]|uniref:Uncharacterized protein n=2 Tax=Meloidogyne enterolobii TaxID=390850 RepID=A0ACB0Y3Q6_MELEN|nr:unnamed protein product [Meloidogyne enterolobii]
MEFLEDEDTKAFFAILEGNYSDEGGSNSCSDNFINDTAEFFDQLKLVHPDNKSVCDKEEVNENVGQEVNEYVNEKVNEDVSQEVEEYVSEEKENEDGCKEVDGDICNEKFNDFLHTDVLLNELMLKWRRLQDKKREFFTNEVKKMELDNALSGRVKKFYKWNEYENGTTCEFRNALEELRMSLKTN